MRDLSSRPESVNGEGSPRWVELLRFEGRITVGKISGKASFE